MDVSGICGPVNRRQHIVCEDGMIATAVYSPIWANAESTAIRCTVKFDTLPDVVPFSATNYDPEPYGRQLFVDLVSGVWGSIAPYVPLP